MIEHLAGTELAAEAKMVRAAFKGAILLVEGSDDEKLYKKLVDGRKCYFLPTHGRPVLLEALAILNAEGFRGVLAIADADLWRIEGGVPAFDNLLATDQHDAELMLCASSAFDHVLEELGSSSKQAKFRDAKGDLRDWLLCEAAVVGRLRLIARRESLSLNFSDLVLAKVVKRKELVVDAESCVRRLLLLSVPRAIEESDLREKLDSVSETQFDLWQLCCGDDVVALLAEALRSAWGSQVEAVANTKHLRKCLRMAFSMADFRRTKLYDEMCEWEQRNSVYPIFA